MKTRFLFFLLLFLIFVFAAFTKPNEQDHLGYLYELKFSSIYNDLHHGSNDFFKEQLILSSIKSDLIYKDYFLFSYSKYEINGEGSVGVIGVYGICFNPSALGIFP